VQRGLDYRVDFARHLVLDSEEGLDSRRPFDTLGLFQVVLLEEMKMLIGAGILKRMIGVDLAVALLCSAQLLNCRLPF
jgi:hypothetical protein